MRVMQRMLQRTADCNVTHLLLSFNWTRPAFPVTVHTCGDGGGQPGSRTRIPRNTGHLDPKAKGKLSVLVVVVVAGAL